MSAVQTMDMREMIQTELKDAKETVRTYTQEMNDTRLPQEHRDYAEGALSVAIDWKNSLKRILEELA